MGRAATLGKKARFELGAPAKAAMIFIAR